MPTAPYLPSRLSATLGLLLWLACQPTCLAQARLKGFVVTDREHGPPAANVAISVENQHLVTPGDGSLSVNFPQHQPGDTVRLAVISPNWAVVNPHALDHTLAANPDARPVEILVAKPSEREGLALNYYRLKGSQAVDQQLQLKLSELQSKGSLPDAERKRLLQERDVALKQVQELARQLASDRSGKDSAAYNRALTFFLDGKIDQALALLNETQLKQEGTQAQTKLKQVVDSWLLRAKLLAVKLDVNGAAKAYEQATRLAPQNAEVWFQFAHFHQSQNRFQEARKGYERALDLCRAQNDAVNIATTLNNLGNLHSDENHMADARAAYAEALSISRALAQKNEAHLPEVAATLNNLGILHRAENHLPEARAAYQEALSIRRTLAQKNASLYLPDVAATLNNLGNLHSDENRLADARAAFDEALGLYRTLARKNPDAYLPHVATTLNNLGNLHSAENRTDPARAAYEEALGICRTLARKNPDAYLPDVAATLNNLGILHRAQNRLAQALAAYEEALGIYRTLAQQNPDAYLPYVATMLNNLGNLHRAENRIAQARAAYEESLAIHQRFAQKSDRFRTELATVQQNLKRLEKP